VRPTLGTTDVTSSNASSNGTHQLSPTRSRRRRPGPRHRVGRADQSRTLPPSTCPRKALWSAR